MIRIRTTCRPHVNALLAADTDSLTAHDIASAATWADKLRDANTNGARQKTSHGTSSISRSARPTSMLLLQPSTHPSGTVASDGPAADCVVGPTLADGAGGFLPGVPAERLSKWGCLGMARPTLAAVALFLGRTAADRPISALG